jgi:uncharacterized protein (DUF488 family)
MHRSFVFTIGHSTRPIDDFIHLLKSHGVQRVVDVRTLPRSRFSPQFDNRRTRNCQRLQIGRNLSE